MEIVDEVVPCTCRAVGNHAPWCGEVDADEVWTTSDCSIILGVTRGKVPSTLAKRGVSSLPDGRRVGGRWVSVYWASQVWTAQRAREGDGRGDAAKAKLRSGGRFSPGAA